MRYAHLAGPERFQAYVLSGPPDDKDPKVDIDELRADLRRLLAATHFIYNLALVRENNRRRVLKTLLWWAGVPCGILLVLAAALMWLDFRLAAVLCVVMFFGCLGAYVSIQRRLQSTSDAGDPMVGILALHEFNAVLHFPLIAGGIFAAVLYFLIAAKLMEGMLFPDLSEFVPMNMTDGSKLFIWSFIAGFAERLVPDTLDWLTNQVQAASSASPVAVETAVAPIQRNTDSAPGSSRRSTG